MRDLSGRQRGAIVIGRIVGARSLAGAVRLVVWLQRRLPSFCLSARLCAPKQNDRQRRAARHFRQSFDRLVYAESN